MSITNVNNSVTSTAVMNAKQTNIQSNLMDKTEWTSNAMQDAVAIENTGTIAAKDQFSEEELQDITAELNNCMQAMNTDIGFLLHKETGTLIVQVEDVKTHKVLKEYPAREFLDRVARIRDCVGVFLDKMA